MIATRRDVLLASAAGVVVGAGTLGAKAQAARTPIKIAASVPTIVQAPTFILKPLKIDQKHGLDAEVVEFGGSSTLMVDAVISGNAHFAMPGVITVMQAIRQGANLTVLGGFANNQIAAVISKTAMAKTGLTWKSPFPDRIKAMKGMTIGTNPVGATFYQVLRNYLQKYGLDPDKDVRLVGIADTPALVAGIHQNRFDVIVTAAGVVEQAITLGNAEMWFAGATGEIPGSESEMIAVAVARTDFVQKEPRIVDAYRAALQEALDLCNKDRDKIGALLKNDFFPKVDATVWKLAWDTMTKGFPEKLSFPKSVFDYWAANDPKGAESYKDVDYKKITYAAAQA